MKKYIYVFFILSVIGYILCVILNREIYSDILYKAVMNKDIKTLQYLLNNNINVNTRTPIWEDTALIAAVETNQINIVKLLLNYNADTELQNRYGETPLYIATKQENLEIMRLLLRHGADINGKGEDNETPLHCAARCGDIETVKFLVSHDADIHARSLGGGTPLFEAAWHVRMDVVKYLYSQGAKINIITDNGTTILHLLAGNMNKSTGGVKRYKEMILLVLSHGTDINATDECGETPLHYAVRGRYKEGVHFIFKLGGDPDIKNRYESSARSEAIDLYGYDVFEEFNNENVIY